MAVINVHDAKTNLSRLLEQVERGEEVVIGRAGKPIARLVPYRLARTARQPGGWEGQVWIAPDFDVLPDEVGEAFRGERP